MEWLSSIMAEPAAVLGTAAVRMIAVLIGLCCHEWGHAFVAHLCGDDTAKNAGRMTLNPMAHLDPVGTLLMLFAGFGYAKPVPVDPRRFTGLRGRRERPAAATWEEEVRRRARVRLRCDVAVSLAGIAVNLILFTLFTWLTVLLSGFFWKEAVIGQTGLRTLVGYRYNPVWKLIEGTAAAEYGAFIARPALAPFLRVTAYTALVNLNLAVFNLIPIPPLDGYHVVNDILFRGKIRLDPRAFRIAMLAVMVLAATGVLGNLVIRALIPAQDFILLPLGA